MTYIFLSNLYWLRCVYWQYLDNRSFLRWFFLRHLLTSREQVPDKWTEWMFFRNTTSIFIVVTAGDFSRCDYVIIFHPRYRPPSYLELWDFSHTTTWRLRVKKNKCALFPDILLFWADHSEFSIDNVIMLRYELWRHGGWRKMFNVYFLSED